MTTDIIIAVASTVAGLIIAHIYHRLQMSRRELCWSIDSTSLIKGYSSLFEKLKIQYGGQRIENLTVSKIVFWNNGNETIDYADIAVPLFITPREAANTQILDVKVIKTSTVGNRFDAHKMPDDPIIALHFNYLDPEQGTLIQVIHTGVSPLPLKVGGEVKGVREIEYKIKRPDLVSQLPRLLVYFYAVMMSTLVVALVYNSVFLGIPARTNWVVWLLGALWMIVLVGVYFDIRQMRDTAKIPKGLSIFEKDDIVIKSS
jgi:hypothetical protein